MRAWIRVSVDAPGCYECAARAERSSATRLRIGQNCRAVCTKKGGLNASGHRDALSNNRHESAARFERPAKAGAGASHRSSSEARGEVCSLSYLSIVR